MAAPLRYPLILLAWGAMAAIYLPLLPAAGELLGAARSPAHWRALCADPQLGQALAATLVSTLLSGGGALLIALTIVATLQSVGIILSISLLIAPGAIALLLVRRFIHALLLAVAVAIGCSAGGVWLAFYLDSAPAPTIVVLFTALFVVGFVASTIRDSQKQKTSAIIPGGG